MAPERLRGDDAAPAADIFALGATLAFAATGRSLITDGTVYQQVFQITKGRFNLSAVPAQLRPMITRCLSYRPRDRPTASDLARLLARAGAAPPTPGWIESVPDPAEVTGSARISRRRVLALGGVLGLVAAGAGAGTTAVLAGVGPDARAVWSPSPGSILWQATSRRTGSGVPAGIIVAAGNRIVTADGTDVRAVDRAGRTLWTRTLASRVLDIRRWGDGVLAADARRVWLLDAATGAQRFAVDAAGAEEAASRSDNADHLQVEIYGMALAAGRLFLNVGTALVALDPTGRPLWRSPRPAARDGRRPTAGNPQAADATWLVTEDVAGTTAEVAAYDAATGARRWSTRIEAAVPLSGPPAGRPPPNPAAGQPPPDAPPDGPHPPPDEAWQRTEARIGGGYVALRHGQEIQVLRISDGRTAWRLSAPRPVVAIEVVGDLLVVAADRLVGYAVATGAVAWRSGLRGARIAVQPDRSGIVAANENGLSGLDLSGATRWQTPVPEALRQAVPDQLTTSGDVAFVTFKPRPDRAGPLEVDVVAVAVERRR
jgi:outer membrane protein assembly factor BamB